ncbi:MAG: type IV pilus twitching motility protein PilT [Candidatus Hydrogenedentes bacterium]|nr:type IV pilus twitching motility protein PilT [Candidatus Hydrogenedentota bacterium]
MDDGVGIKNINRLLSYAVKHSASDLHITVGSPPGLRVDGEMRFITGENLNSDDTLQYARELMNDHQYEAFLNTGDMDLAYGVPGVGRFRVNVFRQRGSVGMVMRHVKGTILDFESLNLPPVMARIADFPRGLVLITGTTGSGKSTTLASIIDWINGRKRFHIITLEDPIEYLYTNKKSVVTQREVTIDTANFHVGLRAAMREDPDVILIGEMRDAETFQAAISASETGHLVFSTLHTTNVMLTIDRLMDMFKADMQEQIRSQVALQLRACISHRLLPAASGKGRIPATEIMINNPGISQLIRENNIKQIPNAIIAGTEDGMQTFNMSLAGLIRRGLIKEEDGMIASDNPEELKMNLQGIYLSQSRGGILKR